MLPAWLDQHAVAPETVADNLIKLETCIVNFQFVEMQKMLRQTLTPPLLN